MAHYFSNFRIPPFGRLRRNTDTLVAHMIPTQPPEEEEPFKPFIPPGCEDEDEELMEREHEFDNDGPVIPNKLLELKVYRYRSSKDAWKHAPTVGMRIDPEREAELDERKPPMSQVRIITWNVDFAAAHHEERLTAALRHIQRDVLNGKDSDEEGSAPEPCCILLQEVLASAVPHLLRDAWVRRWFVVTPHTPAKWPEDARYGSITLVSRSLSIAESHILHFGLSHMGRAALCVKIRLSVPGSQEKVVVAIVNTHLESLPQGEIARPKQLEMSARFLRLAGVHGGVIAGDMNAIGPKDAMIGKQLGLRDAWRKGDIDAGKTWGYQGNDGHPPGRLDKIFYLPGMAYKVDEPKRIGVGEKIRDGTDQAMWISDHYGLETTLRLSKPRSNSA